MGDTLPPPAVTSIIGAIEYRRARDSRLERPHASGIRRRLPSAKGVAMARMRHVGLRSIFSVLALALTLAPAHSQTAPPLAAVARVWADHVVEIEQYPKSAEVVGIEELKVGVTKPRRAKLAPGGPCEAIAWKPIRPGRYSGFWESYKSEIAAYELDKLLGMGMIPPTVEKEDQGRDGSGGDVGLAGEKFQGAWWRARPEGRAVVRRRRRSRAGRDRSPSRRCSTTWSATSTPISGTGLSIPIGI